MMASLEPTAWRSVLLVLGLAASALCGPAAHAKTVVCPGPVTIEGIDISHWQAAIDWGKVKAAGKVYAIIRVSDGMYKDKTFDFNWPEAKKQGLIRGVYQFFRPGQDPIAQADLLLTKMGKLGPADLAPVADVEATDGKPPVTVAANLKKWIDHVQAKTGRVPIIYSGAYFWEDNVKSAAFVNHPLWHAQYCSNCCPNIASPWKSWKFWQYTSSGKVGGIAGNVDLNKWNGTQAALTLFAGGAAPPVCQPHCEGTVVVDKACGKGDCAKFGALCTTQVGGQPKCVSVFCVASPNVAPVAKDVCLPDGVRHACAANGDIAKKPCPAETVCVMVQGAAQCQAPPKPDAGPTDVDAGSAPDIAPKLDVPKPPDATVVPDVPAPPDVPGAADGPAVPDSAAAPDVAWVPDVGFGDAADADASDAEDADDAESTPDDVAVLPDGRAASDGAEVGAARGTPVADGAGGAGAGLGQDVVNGGVAASLQAGDAADPGCRAQPVPVPSAGVAAMFALAVWLARRAWGSSHRVRRLR
ncbi:MAG: hypothetical protein EXR79_08830 [Myxococcales bacterium]|nr:hypothetical protein [Myxococcales bacterium]